MTIKLSDKNIIEPFTDDVDPGYHQLNPSIGTNEKQAYVKSKRSSEAFVRAPTGGRGRLLDNHGGSKLGFYDHSNRIVKVRAFKLC